MKLKPEVKAAWLEDLRSGRYLQGNGALHYTTNDGDKLCCLGVLCEQAVRAGVIPEPRFDGDGYRYGSDNCSGVLPLEVGEWAFSSYDSPCDTTDPRVLEFPLSEWNDRQNADFAKIADLIEAHL